MNFHEWLFGTQILRTGKIYFGAFLSSKKIYFSCLMLFALMFQTCYFKCEFCVFILFYVFVHSFICKRPSYLLWNESLVYVYVWVCVYLSGNMHTCTGAYIEILVNNQCFNQSIELIYAQLVSKPNWCENCQNTFLYTLSFLMHSNHLSIKCSSLRLFSLSLKDKLRINILTTLNLSLGWANFYWRKKMTIWFTFTFKVF